MMPNELHGIKSKIDGLSRRMTGVINDVESRHKTRAANKAESLYREMDYITFRLLDVADELGGWGK